MEAIKIFLKEELEDKLFERSIFNINYWEYVRAIISCEVNSVVSNSSKMFAKNKFNLKKYIPNIKNIKNYFLRKRNADILIVSQPRRINHEGKYKNNYIDYYVDFLKNDYNVLTLEEPSWSSLGVSTKSHEFPLYTENIFLTDFHELNFLFKKMIFKLFRRKKYKQIIREYNELNSIINSWYKLDTIDFKNYFIDSIIRLLYDRKYIKKILNVIKPKIIMLHFMPSVFKEMLIYECNERNIKTIEVQHGTITKVDPLVNKCLDLSKLKVDNKYIFGFGKNQINKYALSIKNLDNVKSIGFPFFEEKLTTLKPKKRKYILIISQSTIGDEMSKFASKLADLLKNTKIKIVFKYHPNEMSRDYKCLKKSNIIEIKNEKNIYDIQNESFLQIGSYSTSLYEGFAMKVPTLVIRTMFGSVETIDIFYDINKGVYFIDSPEDVLDFINKKNITPLEKDIKKLWQTNSKKNLLENIKKIMKEVE